MVESKEEQRLGCVKLELYIWIELCARNLIRFPCRNKKKGPVLLQKSYVLGRKRKNTAIIEALLKMAIN